MDTQRQEVLNYIDMDLDELYVLLAPTADNLLYDRRGRIAAGKEIFLTIKDGLAARIANEIKRDLALGEKLRDYMKQDSNLRRIQTSVDLITAIGTIIARDNSLAVISLPIASIILKFFIDELNERLK